MPNTQSTPKSPHRPIRRILFPVAVLVFVPFAGIYGCRTLAKIEYGGGPSSGESSVSTQSGSTAVPGTGMAASDGAAEAIEFSRRESGILVGPLAASGVLDADGFWPRTAGTDRFMVQDASDQTPIAVVRTISFTEDGALVLVREPAIDAQTGEAPETESGGASSRTVLERTDAGGVVVTFNAASKIESKFDPVMLFLPVTLGAGESIQSPFTVDAKGPRFGTGVGEGTATVRGLGTQAVRTPGGDFEAFVIETESSFQIGPAKIERTRHAWIVSDRARDAAGGDGIGIVAEESSQTVKVFGISFSSKAWVSVFSGEDGAAALP